MTPEGAVKRDIKRFLVDIGAWYCMPMGTGFGKSGVPDFLVCWKGKFYAIEAKAPGKKHNTTTMQDREIVGIHKAGGVALVCDDVSSLVEVFK
jgi:hypothetical protein